MIEEVKKQEQTKLRDWIYIVSVERDWVSIVSCSNYIVPRDFSLDLVIDGVWNWFGITMEAKLDAKPIFSQSYI